MQEPVNRFGAGQGEAMYCCLFLAAMLLLLRWHRAARVRYLDGAGFVFFLLTALRLQGWVLAATVAPWIVATVLLSPAHRAHWRWAILVIFLTFLFPAIWMGYHLALHGDPLYRCTAKRRNRRTSPIFPYGFASSDLLFTSV